MSSEPAPPRVIDPDPYLGEAIAHYPSNRERPLIIAGVVGAAVAVTLNFTLAAVPAWWGPALTVILMGALTLVLAWYVLHIWNNEIILYQRGFSYREGGRTVFFAYIDIASLRLRAEQYAYFGGRLRRGVYKIGVFTRYGEYFAITNRYRRAGELGTRLTERVNTTLRPLLRDQIAAGGGVPFSDTLRMTTMGLHEGGRDLAWADYAGYHIGGGALTILAGGHVAWYRAPLPDIDNIALLVEILRERAPNDNHQIAPDD